jgi:hypothetical protein
MNGSVSRVGLAVGTFAVMLTVGGAYLAEGYLSAQGAASAVGAMPTTTDSPTPSGTGTLPPELVYVRPAPPPQVIHVTKSASPAKPRVVHVTVPGDTTERGDDEGDSSGDD